MSDDFSDSAAASSKSPAFVDAVQRARQIANKIKASDPTSPTSNPGLKRPLPDFGEAPESKKPASINDPYGAQLAARRGAEGGRMMMDGSVVPPGTAGIGGGAPGGAGPVNEVMMVPDKMVGLIIGRGGEQITRLQAESGCKIQMAQDSGGLPERQCTLTGMPSSIAQAKAAIERIIANEGNGPTPRPGGVGGHPGGAANGIFEMMVPGHKVGLIIGKGGEMIKQLQEQSGARIVIIQDSPEAALEKPLRITGTQEAVDTAKSLVTEILNQTDERDMAFAGRGRGRGGLRGGPRGAFGARGGRGGGRGGFGGWSGPAGGEYGGQTTEFVQVPSSKCGLIIGKGGETIKNINQTTGAHCEVDKNAPPDAREKNFIIRGAPDAVERAKSMILEKLGMQGGYGGGGGYGGSSWGGGGGYQQSGYDAGAGGVVVNPQTGQPDYSAQWVEYYRSVGMIREAEAVEAQRAGAAGAAPGAGAAAPGAAGASAPGSAQNGTADYSAQWAEYYRAIGKVKEAEAIEAQMKQKAGGAASAGGGAGQPYTAGYAGYYGNYISQ